MKDFKVLEQNAKQEYWLVEEKEIQLKEKLASGKGGEVFKATWRGLECVVKTCAKNVPEQVLSDLGNEIKILSTIRHPNLVMFLGAAITDHKPPLLLTEYCEGGDFERILIKYSKRGTKMSTRRVRKIGFEVCLAMNFLHQCKPPIIHRDLKPSNILLTKSGTIKISDFGLSKVFKTKKENDKYVMTGETGSYRFMAPEVFCHKEYNEKVDVYSFSMIMYWAASGRRPYCLISDPLKVALAVSSGDCDLEEIVIKNKVLRDLIKKGWNKSPELRPSFENLLKAYQDISSQQKNTCRLDFLNKSVSSFFSQYN